MSQPLYSNIEKGKSVLSEIENTFRQIEKEPVVVFTLASKLNKAAMNYLANINNTSSIWTPGEPQIILLKTAADYLQKTIPSIRCNHLSSSNRIINISISADTRNEDHLNHGQYVATCDIFERKFRYTNRYEHDVENFRQYIKEYTENIEKLNAKSAEYQSILKHPYLELYKARHKLPTATSLIVQFSIHRKKAIDRLSRWIKNCEKDVEHNSKEIKRYENTIQEWEEYQEIYSALLPTLICFFETLDYEIIEGS